MTGWSENHSVDNLVSTFIIRLQAINLKHYKLLPLSSNRKSLKETRWREREDLQVEEVSVATLSFDFAAAPPAYTCKAEGINLEPHNPSLVF